MTIKFKSNQVNQIALHFFDSFNETSQGIETWDEINSLLEDGESKEYCADMLKQKIDDYLVDEKENMNFSDEEWIRVKEKVFFLIENFVFKE